jgi:hypothetical protein
MPRPKQIPAGISDMDKAEIVVTMIRPYLRQGDVVVARQIIVNMLRNERGAVMKRCRRASEKTCEDCRAADAAAEMALEDRVTRVKKVKKAARLAITRPLPPEDTSGGF